MVGENWCVGTPVFFLFPTQHKHTPSTTKKLMSSPPPTTTTTPPLLPPPPTTIEELKSALYPLEERVEAALKSFKIADESYESLAKTRGVPRTWSEMEEMEEEEDFKPLIKASKDAAKEVSRFTIMVVFEEQMFIAIALKRPGFSVDTSMVQGRTKGHCPLYREYDMDQLKRRGKEGGFVVKEMRGKYEEIAGVFAERTPLSG